MGNKLHWTPNVKAKGRNIPSTQGEKSVARPRMRGHEW